MQELIEHMVSDFERGQLSRRELIAHLTMLGVGLSAAPIALARRQDQAPQPSATRPETAPRGGDDAAPSSTFTATGLNHIALSVTDVVRSRDFYMKHLGLTLQRDGGEGSCFLGIGPHFLALFRGSEPGMHHYCYSVKEYTAATAVDRLKAAGLEPDRRGDRVYFPDPDGLVVQVAAAS
jgi:catechol 2,3-dioxygenase-like lactoylglutathione lyase family enzyme